MFARVNFQADAAMPASLQALLHQLEEEQEQFKQLQGKLSYQPESQKKDDDSGSAPEVCKD